MNTQGRVGLNVLLYKPDTSGNIRQSIFRDVQ
jgi:hypothetical protein